MVGFIAVKKPKKNLLRIFLGSLTFEDGADNLSRNASKKLALNTMLCYSRAQISLTPRRNLDLIYRPSLEYNTKKNYTEFWEKITLKRGRKINWDKIVTKLWQLDRWDGRFISLGTTVNGGMWYQQCCVLQLGYQKLSLQDLWVLNDFNANFSHKKCLQNIDWEQKGSVHCLCPVSRFQAVLFQTRIIIVTLK